MDVQMPEMDGFEATAAIRERESDPGRHIPIVAMTAHAMAGDRERCLEAGMDAYVSKPLRPDELLAAVDDLVVSVRGSGSDAQSVVGSGADAESVVGSGAEAESLVGSGSDRDAASPEVRLKPDPTLIHDRFRCLRLIRALFPASARLPWSQVQEPAFRLGRTLRREMQGPAVIAHQS